MKSIVKNRGQVHGGMAKAPHLERMHIICRPKIEHRFFKMVKYKCFCDFSHQSLTKFSQIFKNISNFYIRLW
jgi:hypothetical protein